MTSLSSSPASAKYLYAAAVEVLQSLADAGAEYIQVDEPALVEDDSADYEDITAAQQ